MSAPRRLLIRGVSLVEFMVAIAIGLVLLTGLITLFSNSSNSTAEIDKSIRQIENGRYAVELISENISIAGYYGELTTEGVKLVSPAICATLSNSLGWNNGLQAVPVVAVAPVPVTGLSAVDAAQLTCLANHKAGTPALVLRHLETVPVAAGSATDGQVYLQTSRCSTDPVATRFIVSTAVADFTLKDVGCLAFSKVQRYVTRLYYISTCGECGLDTIPTLKRVELQGASLLVSPLVEGIEDIAYDYGFDTNNDGIPDSYQAGLSGINGAQDNEWKNVVGIRFHILSRTTEASVGFTDSKSYALGLSGLRGPFNDHYKRRAYTLTTRLNNVAGLREIP